MLRSAADSRFSRTMRSVAGNPGMSRAPRCRVALAACAPGSAAGGPPHHHRAAERRRAFRLRPAIERRAASVPGTSFAVMPVAHRSHRCVGGIRRVRRASPSAQRLLPIFIAARRAVMATRVHSPQPRFAGLRFVDPVRALTLRSTGPAGSCFDLWSPSARRAGYLQR